MKTNDKVICIDDTNFNSGFAPNGFPVKGKVYCISGISFCNGVIIVGLPAKNSKGLDKGWQPRRFVALEYFRQEFSVGSKTKSKTYKGAKIFEKSV